MNRVASCSVAVRPFRSTVATKAIEYFPSTSHKRLNSAGGNSFTPPRSETLRRATGGE